MNLKDVPNSISLHNSQIDGVNNNVRHFNVTPESIYLIDYKLSKKNNIDTSLGQKYVQGFLKVCSVND